MQIAPQTELKISVIVPLLPQDTTLARSEIGNQTGTASTTFFAGITFSSYHVLPVSLVLLAISAHISSIRMAPNIADVLMKFAFHKGATSTIPFQFAQFGVILKELPRLLVMVCVRSIGL